MFFSPQIIYFAIIGVTYFFIVKSSFVYMPGYYVSGVHRYHISKTCADPLSPLLSIYKHWINSFLISLDFVCRCRYTSLLAVGVGVLLFLLTSFSDPGTVTAENVSKYISVYPYDNIIYTEKECYTCKIPRYSSHSQVLEFSLRFCCIIF